MAHRKFSKRSKARTMLRLADLQQSKNAVLHSLGAASSQESYGHAIDEFIGWYCSEPRLSFNRTVVLRYRSFLEQKNLAPSTINVRLAAVRRLAYEASDTGLLSPDLAAGIRRVKGAKRLGVRVGNWLTVDQSRTLLSKPSDSLRGKRERAILALLIGCGLRRAELVGLRTGDFQVREEHCVIADLVGKGKHIRTVPVPLWAKRAVDEWTEAAAITGGMIFRRISRLGKIWGDGITPKAIWHVVKAAAKTCGYQESGSARLASHLRSVMPSGRRRTGAGSISARTRFGSDHRTLSRLRAETQPSGERQSRTGRHLTGAGHGRQADFWPALLRVRHWHKFRLVRHTGESATMKGCSRFGAVGNCRNCARKAHSSIGVESRLV